MRKETVKYFMSHKGIIASHGLYIRLDEEKVKVFWGRFLEAIYGS